MPQDKQWLYTFACCSVNIDCKYTQFYVNKYTYSMLTIRYYYGSVLYILCHISDKVVDVEGGNEVTGC